LKIRIIEKTILKENQILSKKVNLLRTISLLVVLLIVHSVLHYDGTVKLIHYNRCLEVLLLLVGLLTINSHLIHVLRVRHVILWPVRIDILILRHEWVLNWRNRSIWILLMWGWETQAFWFHLLFWENLNF